MLMQLQSPSRSHNLDKALPATLEKVPWGQVLIGDRDSDVE